jgi:hypothetical protein
MYKKTNYLIWQQYFTFSLVQLKCKFKFFFGTNFSPGNFWAELFSPGRVIGIKQFFKDGLGYYVKQRDKHCCGSSGLKDVDRVNKLVVYVTVK